MQIICNIDYEEFQNKPKSSDIARISNRIITEDYTKHIKEVITALGNGQSILPFSYYKNRRSKKNFRETNLIMLDFDNTDKILTLDECLSMEFTKKNASFYYETFNSKETQNKYRLGFVLSTPIKNLENFYKAYKYLLEIYPQADNACKDASRIFFGGIKAEEINTDNYLTLDFTEIEITNKEIPYPIKLSAESTIVNNKVDQVLIKSYKNKNLEEIKNHVEEMSVDLHNKTYLDDSEFLKHFNKINMHELFGLPAHAFNCIIYSDKSPSCSILGLANGDYIYKRFSSSKNLNLNNFQLLTQLLDATYNESLKFALSMFNECKILLRERKAKKVNEIIQPLFTEKEKEYKNFHKLLRSNKYIVKDILGDIFDTPIKPTMFSNITDTYVYVSMYSTRTIAEKILAHSTTSLDTKRKRINNILATLTYLGILTNIKDSELAPNFTESLKASNKAYKKTYRMNIYRLQLDVELEDIEKRAKHLVENKITVTKMTAEYLVLLDGVDKSKSTIVQSTKEKVTEIQLRILDDIAKKITETFDGDSVYILEKDLKEFLNQKYSNNKSYIQKNYNFLFSKLEETLDYSRIYLTNELKQQLNITTNSRKVKVIIKNSYLQ